MTISKFITIYFTELAIFLAIDAAWLGKFAPQFYRANIGHLMARRPNFKAAIIFYLIFIFGLVLFVTRPGIVHHDSALLNAFYGGSFGLVCYATFDLTSQAVLKNWPTKITIVDLLWGIFICTLVSSITFHIFR